MEDVDIVDITITLPNVCVCFLLPCWRLSFPTLACTFSAVHLITMTGKRDMTLQISWITAVLAFTCTWIAAIWFIMFCCFVWLAFGCANYFPAHNKFSFWCVFIFWVSFRWIESTTTTSQKLMQWFYFDFNCFTCSIFAFWLLANPFVLSISWFPTVYHQCNYTTFFVDCELSWIVHCSYLVHGDVTLSHIRRTDSLWIVNKQTNCSKLSMSNNSIMTNFQIVLLYRWIVLFTGVVS